MADASTPIDEAALLAWVRRIAKSGVARATRIEAGLSLAETGRAVGVSGAAVCRWERGERSPSGEPAIRYGELMRRLSDAS